MSLKSTEQQWRVSPIPFSDGKDLKFCLNNYLGFLLCMTFYFIIWKGKLVALWFWESSNIKWLYCLDFFFKYEWWTYFLVPAHIISSFWQLDLLLTLVAEIRSNLGSMLRFFAHDLFLKPKNENPHKLVWASLTIFLVLIFLFFLSGNSEK